MVKERNSRMLKSLTSAVQRLSGSISTRWLASLSGRRSTSGPAGGSGRWSRSRSRGWPATSYINKFTKNSLVITSLYIIKKWIMLKEYWNIIFKHYEMSFTRCHCASVRCARFPCRGNLEGTLVVAQAIRRAGAERGAGCPRLSHWNASRTSLPHLRDIKSSSGKRTRWMTTTITTKTTTMMMMRSTSEKVE